MAARLEGQIPSALTAPDIVPGSLTGFQAKKPGMPASAIRDEMSPDGLQRLMIAEQAASGADIIVSARRSVAD